MKKLLSISGQEIDKQNNYLEVYSNSWKNPVHLSINELLSQTLHHDLFKQIDHNTLIIDKETLKIKINNKFIPSVSGEIYSEEQIFHNIPPKDASIISGIHLMVDDNYLYIWVKSKWKRVPLANFT